MEKFSNKSTREHWDEFKRKTIRITYVPVDKNENSYEEALVKDTIVENWIAHVSTSWIF